MNSIRYFSEDDLRGFVLIPFSRGRAYEQAERSLK